MLGSDPVGHLTNRPSTGADTRSVNDEDALEPGDSVAPREGSTPPEGEPCFAADPPAVDVDLQFASIIAHWEDVAPTRPLVDGPAAPSSADESLPPPISQQPVTGPQSAAGLDDDDALFGWRGYAPPPEIDDHFAPGPPDLPPVHDATYWLAVAGMVLGPLIIVWAAVLSGNPDPGWWVLVGIAVTVAGFALMVLRGSGERDPDDNGARV